MVEDLQTLSSAMNKEWKLALDGPHASQMLKLDISATARNGMISLKHHVALILRLILPRFRDENPCESDQKNKNCQSNLLTN